MKTRLLSVWLHLRGSFWFVPGVMMLAAAALAVFLVEIDLGPGSHLARDFPRVFGANVDGARSILSVVASSMISIAGLTFSITIVTLSLASSQYASRILRNFMRDRLNQIVLGAFLSIFVYCLIVLRTLRGEPDPFIPSIAVVTGLALGFVGIAFLIAFIHHVATAIQASTIIHNIAKETLTVIDALYADEHSGEEEDPQDAEQCAQAHAWTAVPARGTGFVQTVDEEALIAWARENQTTVRMLRGIGEFVIAGRPLLAVAAEERLTPEAIHALNACYSIASFRTIEQDAGFGIRQLVDIALRALSPGVNDTTTAVTCLNYLGAILERLSRRKIPPEVCRRENHVRLLARKQTFAYFVDEALNQIRQDARGNVACHLALIDAVDAATHAGLSQSRRTVLITALNRILHAAIEAVNEVGDHHVLRTRFQHVADLLNPGQGRAASDAVPPATD